MTEHYPALPTTGNVQSAQVLGVGARLAAGPAPSLIQTAFARELEEQLDLFYGMSLADIAHTLVLLEQHLLPPEAGQTLLAALLALHEQPSSFQPVAELGDLYTNRVAWLAARTPAAGWLGAGRARREATTTAYRIVVRSRLLSLASSLLHCGTTLLRRAEEEGSTLMADYTYLQPAQPTTFGHYLLGFLYPLLRDLERLQALYARTNLCPAGCGGVNGSRLPINRERLAELLGFDDLVPHTRDAMWQPDGPLETLAVMVACLLNLDRLAEDLQLFATEEFGLVELAESHSRASVIMPQKKNPYALAYVRGVANELIGTLASAAAWGRTPSGQVDNRIFCYGAVPRALQLACGTATLMADVLAALRFNATTAQARLAESFALATDLAEVITLETGLDFHTTHQIVARLVREALQRHRPLKALTLADVQAVAQAVVGRPLALSSDAVTSALDPARALAARRQTGGAATEPFLKMVRDCQTSLAAFASWQQSQSQRLTAAEQALLQQARQQSGGTLCQSIS